MPFCKKTTFISASFFVFATLFTTGCGLSSFSDTSTAPALVPLIRGGVHGGQQPIGGAAIQLYATNTTTLKGPSTALLTTTVNTDSSGSFTITGDYVCPAPTALVYIVATGGNPGLPGTVNNTGIALMAALGTCGTLTSSTFITINELTTVAAIQALAPFMSDVADIGSDVSNPAGLSGAFNSAAALVNFSTGQLITPVSGVVTPNTLLNTLGNILAACINTGGSTASGAPCAQLFQYAGSGTSTDTITALLGIVQSPAHNVSQLFALSSAVAPFQPALSAAPSDFTSTTVIPLPLPSSYPIIGYQMAIDSAQHIWIYTPYIAANGQQSPGSITVYDNNGSLLHTIASGSGGLASAAQLAADPFGNVWAWNSDTGAPASLSKFDSTGVALSPSTGFPFPAELIRYFPSSNNITVQTAMAIDSTGNVWTFGYSQCDHIWPIEFTNSGSPAIPANPSAGTTDCPIDFSGVSSIAVDPSDNVYIRGLYNNAGTLSNAVFEINSSGGVLSPTSGFTAGGVGSAGNVYLEVYDRVRNQIWLSSLTGLYAIKPDGTAVSPAPSGFALPYGVTGLGGVAVDGAGCLWFEGVPVAALNQMDSFGNILTPNTPSQSGLNPGAGQPGPIGVDAYGSIWAVNDYTHTLTKVIGLATPKTYQ